MSSLLPSPDPADAGAPGLEPEEVAAAVDPRDVVRLWEDPADAAGPPAPDPLGELLDDLGRLLSDD